MICITTQYFNFNRILLLAIGLWPYQQSKLVRLQIILLFGILLSFIVCQWIIFITKECTFDFVLKVLSTSLIYVCFAVKYNSFLVNTKAVKSLLEQLQQIYNELKDENEVVIIDTYARSAKLYMIVLTLFVTSSIFIFTFAPFWPFILDILLPINESRPHATFIVTYYFIDQEKYFYLLLLHTDMATCIGVCALVATGTTLLGYIKHACGIFKIASYRIERALAKSILQNFCIENEANAYKEIISAVDIHRKAIKYCEYLNSSFEGSFFFLVGVGVCTMSINLYQIYQAILFGDDMEMFVYCVIAIVILTYIFLPNYFGQEVIDHNNDIFLTAYNAQWYVAPLQVQRQILFLLQRSSKEFTMGVGGLFVASLKTFASLTSASVSYFTVIYSIN